MSIKFGKDFDKKGTFQAPFLEKLKCACSGEMVPIVQIRDEGNIAKNKPKDAELWPHDRMAIVLYMCKKCLKIRAEWNQQ